MYDDDDDVSRKEFKTRLLEVFSATTFGLIVGIMIAEYLSRVQ